MTLFNLQSNKIPVQVVWAGDLPTLIVNRDLTNQVYYGPQSIFDGNVATISIIDPLASVSVDGTQDIWVVAASGTPTIDVTTSSFSWSPSPAQIASQIALQNLNVNVTNTVLAIAAQAGFILTGNFGVLYTLSSAQTIAASSTFSTGVLNVSNYSAYDLLATAYCSTQSTTGAPLVLRAVVSFYSDSGGNNLLCQELWEFWIGNSSSNLGQVAGSGPIRGQYMQVQFQNISSATSVTLNTHILYGTGRTMPFSDWRSNVPTMTVGFTQGSSTGLLTPQNYIFRQGPTTFGASTTTWFPMPLYAGEVWIWCQASAALGSAFTVGSTPALLQNQLAAGTSLAGILFAATNTASQSSSGLFVAPRIPLYAILNTSTTGPSFTCNITGLKTGP